MTLALELSFDAASDRRLHQLWVELSTLYPAPGVLEVGGQPHVSLAVFRRGEPAQIPHCAVAFNVPRERMGTAIDACQRARTPFEATVRRLSAVRYRPAVSVCSSDLDQGSSPLRPRRS